MPWDAAALRPVRLATSTVRSSCAVCFRVRISTAGLCWRPPPLQQAGTEYRCIGSGDLAVLSFWFADWRVSGAVVCCPLSKTVLRVLCSWDCGIPVHWESLTLWHRRETFGVPPLRGRFSLSDHSRVATGGKACEYRRCLNWLLVCCVLGSGNRFLVVRAGLWVC